MSYKRILFATDLSRVSQQVALVAKDLEKVHAAELHIVHVIEPVGTYGRGFYYFGDLEKAVEEQAAKQLRSFCETTQVAQPRSHLCIGHSKQEICQMAKELQADLIVVGSHGASGINRLLGSTASYVLSHADCDVLTVPLKRFEKRQ